MPKEMSRKDFFKKSAKYATVSAAGVLGLQALAKNDVKGATSTNWPYPYAQLDVEALRVSGHDCYYLKKGCSYGAFHALVLALRDAVGAPYTEFPSEISIYGHGGAVGWGTLCGALNGGALLVSLVCEKSDADQLINELIGWYTQEPFPTDASNQLAANQSYETNKNSEVFLQNVGGSPLCHVSVTNWCIAADVAVTAPERGERCARLTGDVAAKTAEILNAHFNNNFVADYVPPESIAACMTCHGDAQLNNVKTKKMECVQCHGDPHTTTSVVQSGPQTPEGYSLQKNYPNPFNPSTVIQFELPKAEPVTLTIYDLNGRHIKTLAKNQVFSQGTHSLTWDGRDQRGNIATSGMYFYNLTAGNFRKTKSMMLVK